MSVGVRDPCPVLSSAEDHEDTRDHHDGAKYEEATQREHVDSFASPQKKWKEVESVSAFRSGSRPVHLPQAIKSPQLPTNMKQDSQKTSSEASGASRTPGKSGTWWSDLEDSALAQGGVMLVARGGVILRIPPAPGCDQPKTSNRRHRT